MESSWRLAPRRAIGEGAASLAIKAPGLWGTRREVDDWPCDRISIPDSVKATEEGAAHFQWGPQFLEVPLPWDNHEGQEQVGGELPEFTTRAGYAENNRAREVEPLRPLDPRRACNTVGLCFDLIWFECNYVSSISSWKRKALNLFCDFYRNPESWDLSCFTKTLGFS